jgi:hypothetical protein
MDAKSGRFTGDHRAARCSIGGSARAKAVAAQLLAAKEMNWSFPCGKPLSK